jgi:stalled ribosome alternative rescue factor ArfA
MLIGSYKMKKKKKTIGVMTQDRGVMPPPVRADKPKKGKGSYNRQQMKRGIV